jgi:hypothetical protein
MKSLLIKYKYQILISIIGLIWVGLFNFFIQIDSQGIIYPDSHSYQNSAKDLYFFYKGHYTRPLLMAFITGLPYLFGANDTTIYSFSHYVNLLCWISFLIVLYEILKEFLTNESAFIFTIISAFFVANTASIFHLQTESIYMLFMVFCFYFLLKYLKHNTFWFLSISLSLFILSMLIKPGSKFLAILFTAYFFRELIKNYKSKFSLFIYGSLFAVFVQCAGMKYQFENFTISYIDVITYYDYLGAKAKAFQTKEDFNDIWLSRAEYIYSQDPDEMKIIAQNDLKQQLTNNKYNLIKAYVLNLFENATNGNICIDDCKNKANTSYFNLSKSIISALAVWQNCLFSIISLFIGFYYLIKCYRNEVIYSLIAFFILYTILISGISCSEGDRFNGITFPFTLILIAKFIEESNIRVAYLLKKH